MMDKMRIAWLGRRIITKVMQLATHPGKLDSRSISSKLFARHSRDREITSCPNFQPYRLLIKCGYPLSNVIKLFHNFKVIFLRRLLLFKHLVNCVNMMTYGLLQSTRFQAVSREPLMKSGKSSIKKSLQICLKIYKNLLIIIIQGVPEKTTRQIIICHFPQ